MPAPPLAVPNLFQQLAEGGSLTARVRTLHDRLAQAVPGVERIACALYDAPTDRLKTFINSTRRGKPVANYEFPLAGSASLSRLAKSGEYRLLEDISTSVRPDSEHSRWLLDQGYQTSFTVPVYDNDAFAGLVFFDAMEAEAFTPRMLVDLTLCATLINMAISAELAALRALRASTHIARDFANLRDFETGAHLERMARYSRVIGRGVADRYGLSDEFIEHVFQFAPLHDIGKIGVPDAVLLKQGPLDTDERRLMQTHVAKGDQIIVAMLDDLKLHSLPDVQIMRNIVTCHHELMDGSGYPKQLAGDAVPIEARIVSVADIFDALTSERPYKKAWPVARACEELERMADTGKLDPACVRVIEAAAGEMTDIADRFRDPA